MGGPVPSVMMLSLDDADAGGKPLVGMVMSNRAHRPASSRIAANEPPHLVQRRSVTTTVPLSAAGWAFSPRVLLGRCV
jgi:hypothetical protein